MYMYCLLSAAVLAAGTGNVTDDPEWANSMRQMLFDYALTRGSNPPNDFVCSVVGKKHSSCHCWNEEGHPSHDQVDHDDCHMPYECLAYSVDSSGDLQYAQIASSQDIVPTLQSWNVPSQMYDLYTGPCQSEEFVPFNYADSAQLAKGALDVHIGVCRKLNGVSAIQIGWGKGSAEADRVVPMVRDKHKVPPGDCHGTERGMTERPYTSDELAFMTKGLSAFAYQRAAVKAQPVSQWPSFDNAAALGADAWGTYFKAIYGSLPTAYPFLVSSLWMLHDTALAKAHVENAPSATTCPHKNFDRYTSNNMYQPPQVSWIWHAYPYTALPAGSRVEVIHEADPFGDETHGMWLQYAPGSGIYFDLGKTIAFDEHSNAYSYFHISGVKDYNSAMSKAAAAQGYDSIQFLKHVDHVSYQCDTKNTGRSGFEYMGLEIVAVQLVGTYPCGSSAGAPSSITRGWEGASPCKCDIKQQFLNCDGVGE